jgi:hypothetical protein
VYLNALLASLNARSKFREESYKADTIIFGTLRSPLTSSPTSKVYMDEDGPGTHTFEVFSISRLIRSLILNKHAQGLTADTNGQQSGTWVADRDRV